MCGQAGARCIRPPSVVPDDRGGRVVYSVVGTGFGNIVHTLLDKRQFKGDFLPGFCLNSDWKSDSEPRLTTHLDHVTYVCPPGQTQNILDWYSNCLGAQVLHFNEDDAGSGMIIKENINIRLNAAKLQVQCDNKPFYLVIAEPLTDTSENHVQLFLEEHGGSGIEHLAFHTDDIMATMRYMLPQKHIHFRHIPVTYYQALQSFDQLFDWLKIDELKELEILLDVENEGDLSEKRLLLQAFTTHIFEKKTFFLEIIERLGAVGFGARNVVNIMKAIESELNNTLHLRQ